MLAHGRSPERARGGGAPPGPVEARGQHLQSRQTPPGPRASGLGRDPLTYTESHPVIVCVCLGFAYCFWDSFMLQQVALFKLVKTMHVERGPLKNYHKQKGKSMRGLGTK